MDTTGDPEVIRDSTRRLSAFGILVLVGEVLGRRLDIDLYPDVHQRGLRIVGVAPPLADPSRRRRRPTNWQGNSRKCLWPYPLERWSPMAPPGIESPGSTASAAAAAITSFQPIPSSTKRLAGPLRPSR